MTHPFRRNLLDQLPSCPPRVHIPFADGYFALKWSKELLRERFSKQEAALLLCLASFWFPFIHEICLYVYINIVYIYPPKQKLRDVLETGELRPAIADVSAVADQLRGLLPEVPEEEVLARRRHRHPFALGTTM